MDSVKDYAAVYNHLKKIEDVEVAEFNRSMLKLREQKNQIRKDLLICLGIDNYKISDYSKCSNAENPIGFCVFHPEDDMNQDCYYCGESEF